MTSGAAKVTDAEKDLSTRVASKRGVYTAFALPAVRGSLTPTLVTDPTQFLDRYTPHGKVQVGYDQAYLEILSHLGMSNKVWISRAVSNALHSSAFARASTATKPGASAFGLSDPQSSYDLLTLDGRPIIPPSNVTLDGEQNFLQVPKALYDELTSTPVAATVSSTGTLPQPLNTTASYVVVKQGSADKVALALDAAKALAGQYVDLTSFGIGVHSITVNSKTHVFTVDASDDTFTLNETVYGLIKTGDKVSFSSDEEIPEVLKATNFAIKLSIPGKIKIAATLEEAKNGKAIDLSAKLESPLTLEVQQELESASEAKVLLIHAADPGKWGDEISWTISNYETAKTKVKEPGAFMIEVYQGTTRVEQHVCSRKQNAKDGRGTNLYVEERVKSSQYIRVIDNVAVADTVTPKDVPTPVFLSGGTDGDAVTDSVMAKAIGKFANSELYPLVLVPDGGWATPAYQKAIVDLCEKRGDCAFVFSTPYEAEASNDYLNEVVTYKTTTLNSESSFGGIYSSHLRVLDIDNNREVLISPTGHVSGKIAFAWDRFEPWAPVAGNKRGNLNVLGVHRAWTPGEMDFLYDNNVNPIRFKVGKGVTIWGQKTLQSRPSDLDRMNARLLLCLIRPAIREALEDFLFENLTGVENDSGTRGQIRSMVDNYMAGVKTRGGVYDYKVVCDKTNNSASDVENNTIRVWLLVKIVKSVEYIPFDIGITAYSMDFSLAESLM